MIGGSDVFMYCCGFGFALGWLTCDRRDFQVFAPTDILMTVSLTDIRAVVNRTKPPLLVFQGLLLLRGLALIKWQLVQWRVFHLAC